MIHDIFLIIIYFILLEIFLFNKLKKSHNIDKYTILKSKLIAIFILILVLIVKNNMF